MAAIPNESRIPVGTTLVGKYRVTREIGRGGMAAVYEAEHLALGKRVAIKVLAAELATSTVVIERFFREARAAASVKSPHIVDVYDSGRLEDGRPFIAMELLEGESLYDRMARIRIIDVPTTVRVISHCAKGLMKAHAVGIVHRDLKPENIFLMKGEDGEEIAKILDFGLAKFYAPVGTDEKTARLTREGAVFGTPAYMSPEQVKGQGSVDHRADLWALGCMAYECLVGRPVWNTDQGVAMTFAAIAAAQPPIPSRQRPDLPPAFDAWFLKALERDPNKRFQSAKELADALARALNASLISVVNFTGGFDATIAESMAELLPSEQIELLEERAGAPLSLSDISAPNASSSSSPSSSPNGIPRPPASGRELALSATDLPPTASSGSVPTKASRPSALRYAVSTLFFLGGAAAAYATWVRVLRPQVFTPVIASTATLPAATAGKGPDETPKAAPDEPKWQAPFSDAQKLYAMGDVEGAIKKLKEAQELGAKSAAGALLDQIRAAVSSGGPCKLAAVSLPRVGLSGPASRPSIASGPKGAVVVWTDDHEQSGHDHAYTVLLEPTGRTLSRPRDVTPEANDVARPQLLAVGDRFVLLYADKSGREAGIRVRWLDEEGRISGASMVVGAARPGNFWPTLDKAPDGFFVVWQDDRDKEGDDLFLRRLGSGLEPLGSEVRLSDYVTVAGKGANARVPAVAIANNALFIAYKLERGPQQLIQRMHVPLATAELSATGLEERPPPSPKDRNRDNRDKGDRTLGQVALINEDRIPADAPAVACGKEGCFLAWHGVKGGAFAAMLEPVQGAVVWRKRFALTGGHPSLAVGAGGDVAMTYVDGGKLKIVALSRDGVGPPSIVGKVSGDQPRPFLAKGEARGEWYVAWQDVVSNRPEVLAGRLVCRP
jgi:serine/threonine-protein kinase